MSTSRPLNLIAELSYRCPLRCAYCSNPIAYRDFPDGLDAAAWTRAFDQAAQLGVVHVGLTGGEPCLRDDLEEIVSGASNAGLYTHLVTAGTLLDREGLRVLQEAGLRSVQLSLQDAREESADRIAGVKAHARKLRFGEDVRALGFPLTVNVVLHRENLGRLESIIALARSLGARSLELANTQYHGWALRNRAALLPTRRQLDEASQVVARARQEADAPEILFAMPDYFRNRPKPCMGGWGQRMMVVTPDGRVLPCHGAAELPGLEFWRFPERELADCWRDAPGMNAFRGEDWMREPCRSCEARTRDFGGCRCQAFALLGDPAEADPACGLAPGHGVIEAAREEALADPPDLIHRSASGS
ncbi:MAG: pyrroloquinoline quinone biosynthesis protein PqqE [Myxococcales bacterium]|nr:pyrroloquinoline quinone biosynthesis protein PqqE [Myxococcales bacterium]